MIYVKELTDYHLTLVELYLVFVTIMVTVEKLRVMTTGDLIGPDQMTNHQKDLIKFHYMKTVGKLYKNSTTAELKTPTTEMKLYRKTQYKKQKKNKVKNQFSKTKIHFFIFYFLTKIVAPNFKYQNYRASLSFH